jgi:tetratricopeptide (TPR) repeat protein
MKGRWLDNLTAPGGTVFVVAALMTGLYIVDKALASLETREVTAEARRHYAEGQSLLAAGKAAAAVDEFRHAHTLMRTNRDFDLALASAELTAGRPEDAEQMLSEILSRNSNDGRANFLMARVRVAQNRFNEAVPFYHRAIYGSWADGSNADKTDARLELADELAKRGRSEELLSELLLLDAPSARDPKLARKVAALYLEAGSASRAEAEYRAMLKLNPKDPDAFLGLGETELRRGEYRLAHAAFGGALRYRPDDPKIAARMQLADQLAQLDPTSRRLGSEEKFRRSEEILYRVEDATLDCLKGQAVPPQLHDLIDQSTKLRAQKLTAMPSNEAAEMRLEMAEQIWKARLQACPSQPAADDPLKILIAKMEQ